MKDLRQGVLGRAAEVAVVEGGEEGGVEVNDVHAGLSRTVVSEVVRPTALDELVSAMREPAAVCGGRYASGGQPFLTGRRLIDLERFGRVLGIDRERGLVTAEAGTRWPTLVGWLNTHAPEWAIRQKQSGADAVSLGGSVSVNAHGRGLDAPPIVADVESVGVVEPDGSVVRCDRSHHAERFRRIIGGYGMFGLIATVTLRLVPRVKLRRRADYVAAAEVIGRFDRAVAAGITCGEFHVNIDETSDGFLDHGVMLTHEPAGLDEPITRRQPDPDAFLRLVMLAHTDKPLAYSTYRRQLIEAPPCVDWSDGWQSAEYLPGYHTAIDQAVGARVRGSEVLSEFFVPRDALVPFLTDAARVLREMRGDLIYGNVRLIERDEETALPWATGRMACIVLNLHTDHDAAGLRHTRAVFRALLDAAIERGGTYYLAYHRFARRDQVLRCYPQLPALLTRADGPCTSDWQEHYRALLG
ncbi:MAG: FAD-binding oxidoreductase [Planctomycetota bacterium]